MRISDWSSDVCSSDLALPVLLRKRGPQHGCEARLQRLSRCQMAPAAPEGEEARRIQMHQLRRAWPAGGASQDPGATGAGTRFRAGQRHLPLPDLSHERDPARAWTRNRSEEHTSELQSLMRISYAVFCLHKNKQRT